MEFCFHPDVRSGHGPLLEQLTMTEDGLEAQPLDRRAASIRPRRR
jgi:hypothetical protein